VKEEEVIRDEVNLKLDQILIQPRAGQINVVNSQESLLQYHTTMEITLSGIYLLSEKATKSKVTSAAQFNYRQVMQRNFEKKGITNQPSMHDAAMTTGGESFQNGGMHMLCYKRGIVDKENNIELQSISKVNYQNRPQFSCTQCNCTDG
jgi:hypothetical protein